MCARVQGDGGQACAGRRLGRTCMCTCVPGGEGESAFVHVCKCVCDTHRCGRIVCYLPLSWKASPVRTGFLPSVTH